jgi:hypothetical protein
VLHHCTDRINGDSSRLQHAGEHRDGEEKNQSAHGHLTADPTRTLLDIRSPKTSLQSATTRRGTSAAEVRNSSIVMSFSGVGRNLVRVVFTVRRRKKQKAVKSRRMNAFILGVDRARARDLRRQGGGVIGQGSVFKQYLREAA